MNFKDNGLLRAIPIMIMRFLSCGCLLLVLTLSTAHHGAKATAESSNSNNNNNKRVAQVGTNLQLPCTPPEAEEILDFFTWSKNGDLLPDHSSAALQSRFLIQGDFSLMIERLREDDEGTYTCHIQSSPPRITSFHVTVEVPATIEHQHPSPEDDNNRSNSGGNHNNNSIAGSADDEEENELITSSTEEDEGVHLLKEGADLDLSCQAKGKPPPVIVWKYQGKVLSAKDSSEKRLITEFVHPNQSVSSTYRILKARRSDSGLYVCQADNGVDLPVAATFNIQVSYAPEILVNRNWVHAGLGSFAELECNVYAKPLAKVTWFRAGGTEDRQVSPPLLLPAPSGSSSSSNSSSSSSSSMFPNQPAAHGRIAVIVLDGGLRHVLRFKNVRDADLGVYTCRAQNGLGRAEAAMELSGIAVPAVLRVAPPRDGINKLTTDFGRDDDVFHTESRKKPRRVYHLIWDVISHSPVYEYRLWLRPLNQPPATWINLIIPTSSSSSNLNSGPLMIGSASSFLHSHEYLLTDLKLGVVYLASVQSRNRFGWSSESNVLSLSGDPEDFDYHDEQQLTPTSTGTIETIATTTIVNVAKEQATLPAVQVIDPVSVAQHGTHAEVHNKTVTTDRPDHVTVTTTHRHHHHTSNAQDGAHHHHSQGASSAVVSAKPSTSRASRPSYSSSPFHLTSMSCLLILPSISFLSIALISNTVFSP